MKRIPVSIAALGVLFSLSATPINSANRFTETKQTIHERKQENNHLIVPNALAPREANKNILPSSIFQKEYFASYYFSNLKRNFGNNIKGSCSYVALDMLLSFYDSYWNDDFVPEHFDGAPVMVEGNALNSTNSPGTMSERNFLDEDFECTNAEYLSIVENYKNKIFHLNLLSIGINDYGIYNSASSSPCGTWLSTMRDITYDYLDKTTALCRNDLNIEYANSNSDAMRNTVVSKVKQGIPVVIDAANSGSAHSFVVYDYDEMADELYANAGWYYPDNPIAINPYSHISMSDLGFTQIQEILYFEPKISHSHSNNYSHLDENGRLIAFCPCNSVIPTTISIGNNFLDETPAYTWNSLIKEKWFSNIGLYHEFSILDYNRHEIYTKSKLFDNKYTLTKNEFEKILSLSSNAYYIYIGLASDVDPYWDDNYCCVEFHKPNTYANKSSFLPSDWGFIGRYYFSNELTSDHLATEPERKNTTVTSNGLTITTDRLRCGYIENSYVVLSPRRENAGRAYFEMNFDKAVYSFMYHACLWSGSEMIDGSAFIEVKDAYGNWTKLKDIPINTIKTKANGLTQFVEQTPSGIYGVRFEVTSTATGTRNKGRFCLDDIVFSTKSGTANNTYVNWNYSTKA